MRLQQKSKLRKFAPRIQSTSIMAEKKKLSIIAFSGDFEIGRAHV